MELGLSTYSIRDYLRDGRIPLVEFAAFAADEGFRALEYNNLFIDDWSDEFMGEVRASVDAAGCTVVCLAHEGSFCSDDPKERQGYIKTLLSHMEAASILGASSVRVNLGRCEDPENDFTDGVEYSIAGLKAVLPEAKRRNLKLTLENHGGPSRSADAILRIILGTDTEWVGTCTDLGNDLVGADKYTELGKLFPFAMHVHAKSYDFGADGEETSIDYARVIRMLGDVSYEGVLAVEYEGHDEQIEGVRRTRELLRRYV
jgi:L-ribulose-5-phosphate 3-epimerase